MASFGQYSHYEFLMVPFELVNTLETFMKLMNRVFYQYLDSFMIVFIDDILLCYKIEADHVCYLGIFL